MPIIRRVGDRPQVAADGRSRQGGSQAACAARVTGLMDRVRPSPKIPRPFRETPNPMSCSAALDESLLAPPTFADHDRSIAIR